MSANIIRNGRVIDPANKRDEIVDLLIIDGKIAPLSQLSELNSQPEEIDVNNLIVAPGLRTRSGNSKPSVIGVRVHQGADDLSRRNDVRIRRYVAFGAATAG